MRALVALARRRWLAALVAAVAVAGAVLAYRVGDGLARAELSNLERQPFLIAPAEAEAFADLRVRGSGLSVTLVCGDDFGVHVDGAADGLFVQQRAGGNRLVLSAQQVDSARRLEVVITTPAPPLRLEARNGARVHVPACAASPSQLTVDLAGGARLYLSGETKDLFLFVATGSSLLAGAQGPLIVEEARVEMVLGAFADLCGAESVLGSVAVSSKVRVRPFTPHRGMRPTTLVHGCGALGEKAAAGAA